MGFQTAAQYLESDEAAKAATTLPAAPGGRLVVLGATPADAPKRQRKPKAAPVQADTDPE